MRGEGDGGEREKTAVRVVCFTIKKLCLPNRRRSKGEGKKGEERRHATLHINSHSPLFLLFTAEQERGED